MAATIVMTFVKRMASTYGVETAVPTTELRNLLPKNLRDTTRVYNIVHSLEKRGIVARADDGSAYGLNKGWEELMTSRKRKAKSPAPAPVVRKRMSKSNLGNIQIKDLERLLEERDIFEKALNKMAAILVDAIRK